MQFKLLLIVILFAFSFFIYRYFSFAKKKTKLFIAQSEIKLSDYASKYGCDISDYEKLWGNLSKNVGASSGFVLRNITLKSLQADYPLKEQFLDDLLYGYNIDGEICLDQKVSDIVSMLCKSNDNSSLGK